MGAGTLEDTLVKEKDEKTWEYTFLVARFRNEAGAVIR
jgi:hypothetical protein